MALTIKRLKELLHYDPDTGDFVWRFSRRGISGGKIAGSIMTIGYRAIGIDCEKHYAHRLAWLYMTGRFPAKEIDHKNGDKADNRWVNLREATSAQNKWNIKKKKHNTSGYKGVHRHAPGKWRTQLIVKGKLIDLGLFSSPELAYEAYCRVAREVHGEFLGV